MHKLGGVAAVGGDSGSPQVPVLTRRLVPDLPWLSRMLAAPLQVDRSGRRAAGVGLDDYLAPVNRLLSWPVLAPFRPLAGRLGQRGGAGQVLGAGAGRGRHRGAHGRRRRPAPGVLAGSAARQVTGSSRSATRSGPAPRCCGCRRSPAGRGLRPLRSTVRTLAVAWVVPWHSTPPELEAGGAPRGPGAAGELREDLLSPAGRPSPAAGGRFRQLALQRLNGASDEELRALFGSDRELLELVAVLSARIPRGDSLRAVNWTASSVSSTSATRRAGAKRRAPWNRRARRSLPPRRVTSSRKAGAAADGGADLAAAMRFPAVVGAKVLHEQVDGAGNFLAGGRALGTGEFHEQVVRGLAQPPGQMLILVAHRGAQVPAVGQAAGALHWPAWVTGRCWRRTRMYSPPLTGGW